MPVQSSPQVARAAAVPIIELMRRGQVFAADCPSRGVLNHVTSRWGTLVLVALLDDTLRFSELRRRIGGVSEKMLAQTLQALESDGFVQRMKYPVVPPHVDYRLTPMGQQVAVHVQTLVDWVETRLPDILQARDQQADATAQRS